MHNFTFVAGAAVAALASAHFGLRGRGAADACDARAVRRADTTVVAGAIVALLLGWAFTSVELGSSSSTVFLPVAAFLAVGLAFSARSNAVDK